MTPVAIHMGKRIFWMVVVMLLTLPTNVMGADAISDWRPIYDTVMRWLNFGILLLLFFKYARQPLVTFLQGSSQKIEDKIKAVEKEKETIEERVRELVEQKAKSQERLEKLKKRIVSQGETKKKRIVAEAHKEGQILMESAKRKISHEIISARNRLKAEMIDQAISLTIQKLPQQMTDVDTQNALKAYLDGINTKPTSK